MTVPVVEAALARYSGKDPSRDERLWMVTREELDSVEIEPTKLESVFVTMPGMKILFVRFKGTWMPVYKMKETSNGKAKDN